VKHILIIFMSLLASCTSVKNTDVLHAQFTNYSDYSKSDLDIMGYAQYFSENIIKKINKKNSSQLLFAQYMSREIDHFSEIDENIGCLTINGVDKSNNPIAFYLRYDLTEKQWLISGIDISFIDSKELYNKKALCPGAVRVK